MAKEPRHCNIEDLDPAKYEVTRIHNIDDLAPLTAELKSSSISSNPTVPSDGGYNIEDRSPRQYGMAGGSVSDLSDMEPPVERKMVADPSAARETQRDFSLEERTPDQYSMGIAGTERDNDQDSGYASCSSLGEMVKDRPPVRSTKNLCGKHEIVRDTPKKEPVDAGDQQSSDPEPKPKRSSSKRENYIKRLSYFVT